MDHRCHKCDRVLFPGLRRYLVRVQIASDPDNACVDSGWPEATRLGEGGGAGPRWGGARGDDLDVEMAFVLCERCRRDFADNPLSASLSSARRPSYLH